MKHLTDEQLALHYYGDGAEESAAVSQHLHECEECRATLGQLEAVLGSVEMPVPERPENYGTTVWHNVRAHLPEPAPKSKWWHFGAAQRWVAFGAVSALLIAAFYLGRMTQTSVQPNPPQIAQNSPAPEIQRTPEVSTKAEASATRSTTAKRVTNSTETKGHDRILLVALGDHLERSQMVLVELMNATPGETLDISSQKQLAGDLVSENRLYRQAAARSKEPAVASLLDELERVLVGIAHEPSKVSGPELENIKQRIEAQGIVFKV